jgi:acyl dehydratase
MTLTVATLDELRPLVGTSLGTSSWLKITQDRIDTFADATDDHQWIHVDPQRAKDGPFGGVVAHGYLTLSLVVPMWEQVLDVTSVQTKVNYGLGKVRFPAPVPVDSAVRLAATLIAMDDVNGGAQLTIGGTIECDQAAKPVCVAEMIYRYLE